MIPAPAATVTLLNLAARFATEPEDDDGRYGKARPRAYFIWEQEGRPEGQAAIFNLTRDMRGEARIVERAFGIGPCVLAETNYSSLSGWSWRRRDPGASCVSQAPEPRCRVRNRAEERPWFGGSRLMPKPRRVSLSTPV